MDRNGGVVASCLSGCQRAGPLFGRMIRGSRAEISGIRKIRARRGVVIRYPGGADRSTGIVGRARIQGDAGDDEVLYQPALDAESGDAGQGDVESAR